MRLVTVSKLVEGQVLAKNILNDNGQILLNSNVALTSSLIRRLSDMQIPYVYIEDERTDDIMIDDIVSEQTRRQALQKVNKTMTTLFAQQKDRSVVSTPTLAKDFNKLLDDIISDLSQNKQVMYHMVNIHSKDDYLYHHSVNVGILATAIGLALNYPKKDLIDLGIGAMLHDIGKTRIPMSILCKPGRLTDEEFDIMRKHSEYGYEILKNQPGISLRTAHVAFQHHERFDGSGYPRRITGNEQHEFAKIVAIADVYDALTSNRVYRSSYLPHEAFELILGGGDYYFEHKIIQKFVQNIAIYPIGLTVTLNTGETAVVTKVDNYYPQRPTVRVITDPNGIDLTAPYEIDLTQHLTTMILSTPAS
ncbi:hypothetical protein BHU72_09550 [Desulfuribacillus stibiiarsenatis]|uniref:Uncharacterized protein n=1 Tax=Desulfuribacillus stibiiarsenatis TaxID=1390249 RepID=A0A1E5L2Y6_9FIRM|nr:HD-GYP domain-containing protein [Desulfuribacillus stibiiarsenatis]OEH84446.1 hypothetical protein BHU72_09550 [Desulfuribacillus stibiiarsenatis]